MRAAVVIVSDGSVALIERIRDDQCYYLFPGGGVEPGEDAPAAAVREAVEGLGLAVTISRLIGTARFAGGEQRYYLADITGGTFGTGNGDEMAGADFHGHGSYRVIWCPLERLASIDVRPRDLATVVAASARSGWPDEPLILTG